MIYYDWFSKEYVAEKEPYAPPERYLEYIKGEDGIYTEKYIIYDDGATYRINFVYSEFDMNNNPKLVALNRQEHFKKNNVNFMSAKLIAFVIPPSAYNKIIEYYKIDEKECESDA